MSAAVVTSPGMQSLDHQTFTALLATPGVQLFDFTAKWCGPCRQMAPVLETLAQEYTGRVRIAAIDCDDEPQIAQAYNVRSMPTFVVVRDGREVGRIIGARPRQFVAGVLDRALGGDVAITAP
ncbi:MAG TPA: thioredoxin family protein [Kofleriaceae bacterium]|nr:thioredoxin family protein [Kofleriaceae bacterium]